MRTDAILLFLAGAAFFLLALPTRDIWQPLETRYATVAREMAETGDWLIPKINGEPYQDKPPLFFWITAALWKIGVGPQGVRVASALAGALTLVVLAAMARLSFSRRAAFLAAAVLATTPEFGWLGRFGELDVTLTLFTTLSAYGWFAGGRRVALFYVGIGLAVMVKGPPGVLVPLLAVVAGRLAGVAPSSPRAPLHPLWGAAVAVLPAALWLGLALLEAGSGYANELIGKHMFGRVADSWQHKQPFYFYLNEALWNFLPWLPFAVPAGIRAWRRRREEPMSAMALYWVLLGLVAFSLVSGKRIAYILPLAPAFALLVARGVEALLLEAERPERRTATVHVVMHLVLAGMGLSLVAVGLGVPLHAPKKEYVAEALRPLFGLPGGLPLVGTGLMLAGLSVAGARLARRRRHATALWTMAAAMAVGFLAVDFTFVARADTFASPRRVAEEMDRLVPPGQGEVGIYPARPPAAKGVEQYAYSGAYNAYSVRLRFDPLRDEGGLSSFLAAPGRRLVVAARSLLPPLPPGVRTIDAGRVDRAEMVFLVNFE